MDILQMSNMKKRTGYWVAITSRGYWEKIIEMGTWGFSEKHSKRVETVKDGDKAIVYLTADGRRYPSSIGGVAQFVGKPWRKREQATLFDTFYPIRLKISIQEICEPPLDFKPFMGNVSFVSPGKNWGAALQGQPIKPISKQDYHFLTKELERALV